MEAVLTKVASQQLNEEGVVLTVQRNPSEKVLASLYLKLWQEGQLNYFFHDRVPDISEYLSMWKDPRNVAYACFIGKPDSDQMEVAGLGSGTNLTKVGDKNRLEVGMAFLRSVQSMSSKISLEFCGLILDDAFHAEDLNLVCVTGTTPVPNKAAVQFLRRIGFREIGICPYCVTWEGEAVPAVLSAMTRDEWLSSERK